MISTLLALALGILAAWLITDQIVHPLLETLKAAKRIAGGDLSHDIKTERRDELSQLQRSMQYMTMSLRKASAWASPRLPARRKSCPLLPSRPARM
ncbi:HAMP domain-containing protein [Pseudomonas sp. QS1027]|uniref:HAMP domain-containing protein n=1 Tax=unclassified Pseudomonas TaxID=196821 RepID=UPI003531B8C7